MGPRFQTIRVEQDGAVARVVLDRPDVRNAINDVMIRELGEAFRDLGERSEARVVVVQSEGPVFCAGADLDWMKRSANLTPEENRAETMELARVLEALDEMPKPTLARVQGAVMGGGVGVAAACDIVVASEEAFFALSEVRLGLAPAVISPFVLARIGRGPAREFFLTGSRISARRAYEIGLVNHVAGPDALDEAVVKISRTLLKGGPAAQVVCKGLIRNVPGLAGKARRDHTARVISELRAGDEGQEGMEAFFGRRSPSWFTPPDEG